MKPDSPVASGVQRRPPAGFTLLEMLVVLAIGTLLLVTLQQAFHASVRSAERVHEVGDTMMRELVRGTWLRQVLLGAVIEPQGQGESFKGDESSIQATSSMPLLPGGNGEYSLSLAADPQRIDAPLRLLYRQNDREVELGVVPAGSRFAYRDEQGRQQERWPAQSATADRSPPLPSLVAIVDRDGKARTAVAMPRAARPLPQAGSPFSNAPK